MILFLLLFGGIFFAVGFVLTAVFASLGDFFGGFMVLPLTFMLVGLGILIYAFILIKRKKDIVKKGTRYPAKIYGYVENKSFMINNDYAVNIKVRFFDAYRVEREVILDTSFPKGSENQYGIGLTIDIFEWRGRYGYDKNSVRFEPIWGEEELMDDKPIAPENQNMIASSCPNCGASFTAVRGYSNKCPYCGSYLNA